MATYCLAFHRNGREKMPDNLSGSLVFVHSWPSVMFAIRQSGERASRSRWKVRRSAAEDRRIISPCGSYGLVRSWCWCEPRWARRCCCSYFHQFQRSCAVRSVAFVQKWPFFFTAWLDG